MLCLRESNCRLSNFAEVVKIAFRLPTTLFSRFDRLKLASWNLKEFRSSTSLSNLITCSPKGYLKFFGILNSSSGRWVLVREWGFEMNHRMKRCKGSKFIDTLPTDVHRIYESIDICALSRQKFSTVISRPNDRSKIMKH